MMNGGCFIDADASQLKPSTYSRRFGRFRLSDTWSAWPTARTHHGDWSARCGDSCGIKRRIYIWRLSPDIL